MRNPLQNRGDSLLARMRRAQPGALTTSVLAVSDQEQIASLQRQLTAKDATIGRLTEQLLAAPTAPAGDGRCPGCAGLERTVRQLEGERNQLRGQLAAYRLEETRHQRVRPPAQQLP